METEAEIIRVEMARREAGSVKTLVEPNQDIARGE